MRIAIFGASGGTGRILARKCLEAGYEVTALARRPESLDNLKNGLGGQRLRVVQGSAFDTAPVEETIAGADAVMSALGAKSPLRNENVLPRAVPVIVSAMEKAGVKRIIVLGSAGAKDGAMSRAPGWKQWLVKNVVETTLLKWPVHEQRVHYRLLEESGLEWTMAMPPMLTNSRGRGVYRVDGRALPENVSRIAREDVADFMMKQLTEDDWVRQAAYIAW
jgi:putative NADH-flavin reductase